MSNLKYIEEFRNKEHCKILIDKIRKLSRSSLKFMEVCGGHTLSIQKFGIDSLLPENIELVSGPGCPVCVSSKEYIDKAIELSKLDNVIITTFGDLIRVPGSYSSLEKQKSQGADIRIVLSINDSLRIAKQNPNKKIIFLGIGFETTAPGTAAGILKAIEEKLDNFYVFSSHKIMPPAMAALIDEGIKLNGYIAPGHVSTITGSIIYDFIPAKYNVGVVISGFEPLDLLYSIYLLLLQCETNNYKVDIAYRRAVKPEGNVKAKNIMNEVFELRDDWWRGLGIIPNSGLKIKDKYSAYDVEKNFDINISPAREEKGCICGEILKGLKKPKDCSLFVKVCNPSNPIGACMVSSEGACSTYYKYNKD